jgi:hypothetical protein
MREPTNTRVPFTGTHGRYAILNETPTWVYHTMAGAGVLDGTAPATALTTPAETDPVVLQGRADYNNLTHGGLFITLANYGKAMIIDSIYNPGSSTITIVNPEKGTTRSAPASAPYNIAPGECLKAVGGSQIGFMVREDLPYR